ncbi:DUF4919 domain-containing protein [Altibacter sp.]|uniref:DUF4919 domain-containing protein n=1 Tax=Altibacter sp. TaxID=2024823 RepID=UPI000C89BECC|nr:DUF4919 domain-containing protein [Altibacter sp.]MAP55217.1 hypothetical protein [Altibacter sp.]
MKKITTLLFLVLSATAYSQSWDFESPNYKEIEKNIQDKASPLFYDTLMVRFQDADSTLTLQEKRHLYYGFSFHDKYAPYSHSKSLDNLMTLLKKETLSESELDQVVNLSDSLLTTNPFDVRAMNYKLFAFDQKREKENFKKTYIKMNTVFDALLSSGNGTSKEESFYVIYTSHEYDLLNILGFQFGGMQQLIEHYDYLTVAENEAGIEGLYFDVSPCLNAMSNMLGE